MKNVVLKSALLLAATLVAPCSFARDEAPDAMLSAVSAEVISILNQDKDIAAGIASKVPDLVEAKILPLFDLHRMTQIALARNLHLASAEQHAMLTTEFKTLLLRVCSVALLNYRDRGVEFRRVSIAPGDTIVRVRSAVRQPGREFVTIDYDVEKTATGWKVYDIKMDGVSLIIMYRESFAEAVRDKGIDGLIKSLSDKNRQAGSGVQSARTTFLDQARIMFAMLTSALQGRR